MIVRLGADIGLECTTCRHKVLLTRRELARRMKLHQPNPDQPVEEIGQTNYNRP